MAESLLALAQQQRSKDDISVIAINVRTSADAFMADPRLCRNRP
jgi:hypothetical protein